MTEHKEKYLNWTELQHALGDDKSTLFINQLKPHIFFDGMVEVLKFNIDYFSPKVAKSIRSTYSERFYSHMSNQTEFDLMYEPNLHGYERHTFRLKGFLTIEFIQNLLIFKTADEYFIDGELQTKKQAFVPDSLSGFLEAIRPKITTTKETAYKELVHTFDYSGKKDYNRLKSITALFNSQDVLSNAKRHSQAVNLTAYQEYLHSQAQKAKAAASYRVRSKGGYDQNEFDEPHIAKFENADNVETPINSFINDVITILSKSKVTKNYSLFMTVFRHMSQSSNMTEPVIRFSQFYQYILDHKIPPIKSKNIHTIKYEYYDPEISSTEVVSFKKEVLRGSYDKLIKQISTQ